MKKIAALLVTLACLLAPQAARADLYLGTSASPGAVVTAPQTALNTDLLSGNVSGWFDALGYNGFSIQINGSAGISAGAIIFEQSNDPSQAGLGLPVLEPAVQLLNSGGNIGNISASTTRIFLGQIQSRYIRVRISTAFVGGTVQAAATFTTHPFNNAYSFFYPQGTPNLIGDVGVQYRASATGAALSASIMAPATPAATAIKASAGRLLAYDLQNSAASVRSFKCANLAVGSVTLGTTAAAWEIDIPAAGRANMVIEGGLAFSTAITCWVTGAKGLTDNTAVTANDVSGFVAYQ